MPNNWRRREIVPTKCKNKKVPEATNGIINGNK
jgi:hypothetical protein